MTRRLTLTNLSRQTALLIVAFCVFATPAMASLVVQNYMQADFSSAEPCFFKASAPV